MECRIGLTSRGRPDGRGLRRGDHRVHVFGIRDVAPLRTIAQQDPRRVDHRERRLHERGEVRDRHVDVLVQAVPSATGV